MLFQGRTDSEIAGFMVNFLLLVRSPDNVSDRGDYDIESVREQQIHKDKENSVISLAYTVTDPRAVVVHSVDTAIANGAVDSPWGSVKDTYIREDQIS